MADYKKIGRVLWEKTTDSVGRDCKIKEGRGKDLSHKGDLKV